MRLKLSHFTPGPRWSILLGPTLAHPQGPRVPLESKTQEMTALAGIAPFIKKDQDKDHRRVLPRTQRPGVPAPRLGAAAGGPSGAHRWGRTGTSPPCPSQSCVPAPRTQGTYSF